MDRTRLTLDNPVFVGRLRQVHRSPAYVRRPTQQPAKVIQDIVLRSDAASGVLGSVRAIPEKVFVRVAPDLEHLQKPKESVVPSIVARRKATASRLRVQKSSVLGRNSVRSPMQQKPRKSLRKQTMVLYAMAAVLFVIGVSVSLNGLRSNRQVAAQVKQLQKTTVASAPTTTGSGSQTSTVPSTKPVSTYTLADYTVAPDLARYIKIPKLGVYARVLQVGTTKEGALATPNNVFDTAWYNGSSKPGDPGATLIDGHVSSWTTNGVFYGLKKLVAGDEIIIQRGDGKILTYKVVTSKVYPDDKVDMQAAVTPIVAGKSGLNLITCTGRVKPGTSEFNQRIIVFATLED